MKTRRYLYFNRSFQPGFFFSPFCEAILIHLNSILNGCKYRKIILILRFSSYIYINYQGFDLDEEIYSRRNFFIARRYIFIQRMLHQEKYLDQEGIP